MNFHPYCEVFPPLEGDAFDALVTDIKTHGLREEIWTLGGLILDGRNRYLACQKANEKPRFRTYTGSDPAAFVLSANAHRRHLTVTQRATAVAKLSELKQRGGDRRSEDFKTAGAVTDDALAKAAGVSADSVQRARKVEKKGSASLKKAVEKNEIPLTRAAAVVDLPKSEQLAAAKSSPPRESDEPERPDESEDAAALEAAEHDWRARIEKVLSSDDKLAAMAKELKQAQDELTAAKQARDRYMNENAALLRQNKALQRKLDRLEKKAA